MATINMQVPEGINNGTMALVVRFASALAEKLRAAEVKYGHSNRWMHDDWMDECREKLADHLRKGDPRDVAAYCAFLWHHGEPTHRDTDSHVIAQWKRDQKASARIAALEAEVARVRETIIGAALQVHCAIDQLARERDTADAKVRLGDLFDTLMAALSPKEPK